MRTFQRAFCFGLLLGSAIGLTTGCQSGGMSNAEAEAKMRAAYKKKSYSLSDVPPQQRAMVEAFMKSGKSGQIPAPPPSPAAK